MADQKTCFVVQGFGKKTDFQSGRTLDLDASYEVIKEAVEAADMLCIRADEIQHSGVIDKPMYEQLLEADLVIADLSTANVNAFYELGVRHGVRPHATILVAEDQFKYPFDLNHVAIRSYKHLGDDVGRQEAKRFAEELAVAIKEIIDTPVIDSPFYVFMPDLSAPAEDEGDRSAALPAEEETTLAAGLEQPVKVLMDQAKAAMKAGDFITAKGVFVGVRAMMPGDDFVLQQMAIATYKSELPDPLAALKEAAAVLEETNPATSNDTETIGIYGSIYKRLWQATKDPEHLSVALRSYGRGFWLRNDYYNGINLAYLYNVRASVTEGATQQERAAAVADWVSAQRIRREVVDVTEAKLASDPESADEKYWLTATLWEAHVGLGNEDAAAEWKAKTEAAPAADWMKGSTTEQIALLEGLLADSPVAKWVAAG